MTHVCMWEDCFVLEKANNFVKKILVLVSVSAHKHGPVGADFRGIPKIVNLWPGTVCWFEWLSPVLGAWKQG